jgi:hypothetical protein
MNKYKSFLILLGIFCAVLVGASFMIAGTPVSQQAVSLDQIRINNFNEIHTRMDEYYRKNNSLPESLKSLGLSEKLADSILVDPVTKSIYEYKPANNPYTYEICTTFSTDSSESDDQYYQYSENDLSHIKGYDCVTYRISSYILTPSPVPVRLPSN